MPQEPKDEQLEQDLVDKLKQYMLLDKFEGRLDTIIEHKQTRELIFQKEAMMIHFSVYLTEGYLHMSRHEFRHQFYNRKILLDDRLISEVSNGLF